MRLTEEQLSEQLQKIRDSHRYTPLLAHPKMLKLIMSQYIPDPMVRFCENYHEQKRTADRYWTCLPYRHPSDYCLYYSNEDNMKAYCKKCGSSDLQVRDPIPASVFERTAITINGRLLFGQGYCCNECGHDFGWWSSADPMIRFCEGAL